VDRDTYAEPEDIDLDTLREQDTVLQIAGRPEPFHHVDNNVLVRTAPPKPNPGLHPAR
jgi:hypothetical protein